MTLSGVLAALVIAVAAGPARAEGFLGAYEDLPLPPGINELPGQGLSFDSPGGRIIEAYARGSGRASDVLKFYAATLPQLGWQRESDTRYRREAELLVIDAREQGRAVTVHYMIAPE